MEKPVNRHQSSDITLNNICSNDNDHEDGQDENNDISMTLFMERSLAGNYVIQDKRSNILILPPQNTVDMKLKNS